MRLIFNLILISILLPHLTSADPISSKFTHPGIYQTNADLEYMKNQVKKGEQPWKEAFDRLKSATDLGYAVKAHTHVMRGPYGKPNIGGEDLSKTSSLAYDCALLWYITGDKQYAGKAIEILRAWPPVLWAFDYNDAKLLAGWTGHQLCNAAEILRYTDSGWNLSDQQDFTRMLMTVYYPLLRFYYPQANGNWDGAIIQTLLAMAIFTDDREMFENAIDHFLHGPVNGSIFKYIWPSGQCQETARDQAHVQLGLGEFAGAARIAYSQGVDLFSIAGNRIGLGYEYTANFILGNHPFSYGIISERAKTLRDDYEYVYRHYAREGVDLPWTKRAADSIRYKSTRSTLTAFRYPPLKNESRAPVPVKASSIGHPAGALDKTTAKIPDNMLEVSPGQSLQAALDLTAGTGRWVLAKKGVHIMPETLKIPSGTTLCGEGIGTILLLDPKSGMRDAIVNMHNAMSKVNIRDLVVEGAIDPDPGSDPNSRRSYRSRENRGGIIFRCNKEGEINQLTMTNVTVRNCTFNGVYIAGGKNIIIEKCNFEENGASVVPGPRLQHNLLLNHCSDVFISDGRFDTSPHGCGISLEKCREITISRSEIARNSWYGILVAESKNLTFTGNLVEGNDQSGIMLEFLYDGTENVTLKNNLVHYNNGFGIESHAARNLVNENNILIGNGMTDLQAKIDNEKFIIRN